MVAWVAGSLAAALLVTFAVVANGFDSRETPREDPSIWVERVAGQYARVNTETAEIDTVRVAESTSGVVQTGELGLLLTQGFGRAHAIDPAAPVDVHDDGADPAQQTEQQIAQQTDQQQDQAQAAAGSPADALRTPSGTRQVLAAAERLLFFTQEGETYLSQVQAAGPGTPASLSTPLRLDPLAPERQRAGGRNSGQTRYLANAAALDAQGRVALFSQAEHAIRWFDAAGGQWIGAPEAVPDEVPAKDVQLAIVHGDWVLFDSVNGLLWRDGAERPVELDITGSARLQDSSTERSEVLIADESGLWRVAASGSAERIVAAAGVAAQPRTVDGEAIAAWVGSSGARIWTSDGGELELELDTSVEDLSNPDPEIRSNGSRALIAERRSGMMWTVPDGRLIPVAQWSLIDPPKQESGTVVTQDVMEQEPPVAVDDAFGVRAGEPALLPLLLNDFDPNRRDVLTVVPEGLGEGLSADFGTVSVLSDGQGVVLQPSAGASGSASFSYQVTDGVQLSKRATVTLTVADGTVNTAPQWCQVEGCRRSWPSPELSPGGTLILPILEGWVDPEGDPMMLAGATVVNEEDPIRALVTSDGRLAVRHIDPNAAAGDSIVRVRIVDSRGAETERELQLRVRNGAAIEFASAAATVKLNEPTALRPLERVTGGSGSFQLVDATVQQGSLAVSPNPGGTVEVVASAAGTAVVNVTVRDTVTGQEAIGTIRVTAVEARESFAVPPLRAYLRPLADSTVDVLAAIPGSGSRALTVRSATVRDGQLRADVIEHSSVRVSGSTSDGQPGRIGAVDVVVAEGDVTGQGRLTVFQVDDIGAGAIAVTDTATVRAGSVVDIPVLDNDVAPPGGRLMLHPEVGAPGAPGELAFASGNRVRYLAPSEPGRYTLSYTIYGAANPELRDVGQVQVTVLAAGANRNPQPATVTARVAPGEMVRATIPLSGVDPDGDRVRLISVGAPTDAQLTATILPRSNVVQVTASGSAQRGSQIVNYTVRDSFGGEATGRMRLIVTEPDSGGGAPVVYSDYVRLATSESDIATVRPLENDLDPSGGTLRLLSVEPNLPGGRRDPGYDELRSRLDLSELEQGIVRIKGSGELGTVSFKYKVSSSTTKSTSDGLIVVQLSERVGQQAPSVADTVLSVRDRADFSRTGVDVVTDRVQWAAGDVSGLRLSLWGAAADRYTVRGSSIFGSYRAEGELIPFRLSGADLTGAEVDTFGFLIVPPLDELRLSLKPGTAAISVAENKSIDVDIGGMLDLGPDDVVELEQTDFSTQRQQAACTAIDATTIRYRAGKEAPWSDSCGVRVRLTEQTAYTTIPIAVSIVPDEPVVQLHPLTRTIAPGAAETIALTDMVQWQGGRGGSLEKLQWQLSGGSSAFEVVSSGAQLQVQARADAVPGKQEVLTVAVSGAGESQSLLTLRVGEAARDEPSGGTVALQCTVGSPCRAQLVGIAGEHDPFAGKNGGGLRLVSVSDQGCRFGSMRAADDAVEVAWADPRGPGGRCTASFTVRDAQQRTGTGTIEFDAQGVPRAPVGITPLGADATSVTLSVALSGDASHPEVTGVKLLSGGTAVGSCSLSGGQANCTVHDLTPGVHAQYTAVAVNAVGDSAPSVNGVETWAYRPPPPPKIEGGQALKWPENTDPALGKVRINVGPSPAANRVLVIDGEEVPINGDQSYLLAADGKEREVYAYSLDAAAMIPPGYLGGDGGKGDAAQLHGVVPIGAPVAGTASLRLSGPNRTDWTIDTDGWRYLGPDPIKFSYSIGDYTGSRRTGAGLAPHRDYFATVSAATDFGVAGPVTSNTEMSGSRLPRIDGSYDTARTPTVSDTEILYPALAIAYSPRPEPGAELTPVTVSPERPTAAVTQCAAGGVHCSEPGEVAPSGLAPLRMTLTSCVPWNGVELPNHTEIAEHVTVSGEAGGGYSFLALPEGTILVDWGGIRGNGSFAHALCPADPADTGDPMDPADPGGPVGAADARAQGDPATG